MSLLLTVASTALACGALYGYQLYRASHHARTIRIRTITEMASISIVDAAYANEDRKEIVWTALTRRETDLAAAKLIDQSGEVLFARGELRLFDGPPSQSWSGLTDFTCWIGRESNADISPQSVSVGILPIRERHGRFQGGSLMLAVSDGNIPLIERHEVWSFFAALLAIGITGIILGGYLLSRNMLTPLKILSRHIRNVAENGDDAELQIDRDDEIGQLAEAFRQMQGGLKEWRSRATHLEYTMDRRVNAETRRIQSQLKNIERKAWTDPLTGLGNRRLFDDKFQDIYDAQLKTKKDLAVVMIDIDNFKQLNDTLGHQAGDELLHFTGELLRQGLRENDLAIRLGGDEFMLILPSSSSLDASAVAQRTIRLFGQRAQLLECNPKPSMSAGIACISLMNNYTAGELIRRADEALYRAKRSGKGRVMVAEPTPEPAVAH